MADQEEGEQKVSKSQLKKQMKKEAKEQAKAAKQVEPAAEAETETPIGDETTLQFGVYPIVQSTRVSSRVFVNVADLNASYDGKTVWVRARVFTSRSKGNSCFLLLRRGMFSVQAALFKSDSIPKEMVKFAASISKESIVDIEGQVVKVTEKIQSATQQDVEIHPSKLFVVSQALNTPIQVEDCLRPEPRLAEESTDGRPLVALKTRLDHRYIDLRAPVNLAIFRVQSGVGNLFREYLYGKGFVEIHSPKIIGTASEGGSQVFRLDYFEGNAYLAQSPQLYKQMAVMGDLDRVFEIAPVFRAENSFTPRHLTEFVGLDMEMAIQDHYYEVLAVINEMFKYIFNNLEIQYAKELAVIRECYKSEPVTFGEKFLILHFAEGVRLLREAGETVPEFEDISTPHEKLLGKIVKEKFGTDFYAMDRYPAAARAFYTMPAPDDPRYSNSYDIFLRGQEISSGAQRIHDPKVLLEVAASKGIDMTPIQSYVDSFKYGAFPHGGCGIGLERVVMLYLGLHDIRKASMFPRDPTRTTP